MRLIEKEEWKCRAAPLWEEGLLFLRVSIRVSRPSVMRSHEQVLQSGGGEGAGG